MDFIKMIGFILADFFGFTLPILLRKVITFIDGLIYTADAELYDLIVKIAQQEIFSKGTLNEVAGRVYQLLALIMVFRLIFMFVTYIVNPDDMMDKTKGYQNVIRKMVITLGLIIITPWAFQQARVVQQLILEEGVIEYFVFGQSNTADVSSGYEFMHTVGMLFVTPYKCINDDCKTIKPDSTHTQDDVEIHLCEHAKWDDNISVNNRNGDLNCHGSDCATFCGLGTGDEEFQTDPNYASTLFNAAYPTGDKYDLQALMSIGGAGSWETQTFYAEYKFPFIGTTLVGILIGYMLIIMCIDIALRSVKLSFYELIAPIPIVSYIGPKDGKETMLNKWFSQVLKTYADLFTRIAGLEIAVFFIDTLLEDDKLLSSREFFVELFLILGALTFAKKLPDILKDLGVKFETGNFSLKKSLSPISPLAGAAAGTLGGMAGNFQGHRAAGHGMMRSLTSAAFGAAHGAVRGGMAGIKDKDGMGIKTGLAAAGKGGQNIYNRAGTNFVGRHVAQAQTAIGAKTQADRMDEQVKANETYAGFKKTMKDNADFFSGGLTTAAISGGVARSYTTSSNAAAISSALNTGGKGGVKGIKQYYEDLQKSGTATQEQLTAAREAYEDAQQHVIGNARTLAATTTDPGGRAIAEQLQAIKGQAARYAQSNRSKLGATISTSEDASWSDLNAGFNAASNEAVRIKTTPEYGRAQANKNFAQTGSSGKK